jgi:hypothetical protein
MRCTRRTSSQQTNRGRSCRARSYHQLSRQSYMHVGSDEQTPPAWKFLAAQHRTAPECLAPSQPELEHTACVDGTKRLPIDDPEELSASMGGILCVSHRVRVSESEATGMAARGKRLVLLHGGLSPHGCILLPLHHGVSALCSAPPPNPLAMPLARVHRLRNGKRSYHKALRNIVEVPTEYFHIY